jgi:DNA (cytosine-5)-methyltransferase 1
MVKKPLILDLFCGAGGAAKGYADAGFDGVGGDIAPQPNYPYRFIQDDALAYLRGLGTTGIDVVHASPPCQHHSALAKGNNGKQHEYPELIGPTRELLQKTGLPYVIENVQRPLRDPVVLCGEMLGCR